MRRNKKTPTLDSTLAMDGNNSVIATSYHQVTEEYHSLLESNIYSFEILFLQLDDSTVSTPLSARHLITVATTSGAGGSRGSTPLPSPRHSRQGSAAAR